jgi:excinuclease ABC subunit C
VQQNAQQVLEQQRIKWLSDSQKTQLALEELQEALNLAAPPQRIECYDISNTQGTNSVGAMVVFEAGRPKNSEYRRFKIKTVEGPNDFASHQEVLRRRFRAIANKQNTDSPSTATTAAEEVLAEDADIGIADGTSTQLHHEWAMPDLIIIDGGKGQLSAAMEVLQELRIDIPTVGLAKENEEIFTPGSPDPIILPRSSQGLYMVQRIRDEAHRFGITYHRKLRSDRTFKSVLDEIPGIGPKRKQALMKHFGSVRAMGNASVEDLAALDGMTRDAAEKVKEYIGRVD